MDLISFNKFTPQFCKKSLRSQIIVVNHITGSIFLLLFAKQDSPEIFFNNFTYILCI